MSVPLNGTVFNNVELDQDRISRVVRIRYSNYERVSFHNVISGSPDGSILVQTSNDPVEEEDLVTNWADYPNSSTNILGVTQLVINIKDLAFRWVRLVYISVSDTGFITSNFVVVKRYP